MADKKIETFKIGDSHRAGMSAPTQKTSNKIDEGITESLGFSRIEHMLESEDPELVGEGLTSMIQQIETLRDAAKTNKDKLSANKAIAAIERAVDLLDYLYETKSQLESGSMS